MGGFAANVALVTMNVLWMEPYVGNYLSRRLFNFFFTVTHLPIHAHTYTPRFVGYYCSLRCAQAQATISDYGFGKPLCNENLKAVRCYGDILVVIIRAIVITRLW